MTYRKEHPYQSSTKRELERRSRQACLVVASCSLAVAGMVYGAAQLDARQQPHSAAPAGEWQLVQYYKGDAFILDHGLTHDDCDDATPRNQAAKGLRFACELEG